MSVLRQRILLPYVPLHEDKSASGPRKEGIQARGFVTNQVRGRKVYKPAASSPIKSAEVKVYNLRLRHRYQPGRLHGQCFAVCVQIIISCVSIIFIQDISAVFVSDKFYRIGIKFGNTFCCVRNRNAFAGTDKQWNNI